MKIFDCTLFYDEDMILEIRLNVLNKYVDKFVISESKYTHSGAKKKLNFDIKKFSDFKKKIIYIPIDDEPDGLIYKKKNNDFFEEPINRRANSVKRIAYQRNKLMEGLSEANDDDFIFYNDNDEIPNFANFDFEANKNNIIMFKQKLFYYKFNLYCDRINWYGTKGCKKKDLYSFGWLREIKPKKYPFYRLDTFISKNKYMGVKIVDDGGWHFSQLKTPRNLEIKFLNQEHHDEYKLAKEKLPDIADLIRRKTIVYDFGAKTTDYKFSKEFKLKTVPIDFMPSFLKQNVNKYTEWFDLDK